MTESRGTDEDHHDDDEEFLGYMGYGDGAMLAVSEREGSETLAMRGEHGANPVRENLEEALRKWNTFFFGGEEDGDSESEGEGV